MATDQISYAVRSFTIAPGETVSTVRTADFVTCLEASTGFKIRFDDGSEADFEGGLTYRPGNGFERLQLRNTSANALTVRLAFGRGLISDARVTISEGNTLTTREGAPDVLDTPAPIACASGAVTAVAAADGLRREILIVNPATSAGAIYIGGNAAAVAGQGVPVEAGQALTLQTAAAVYCRNDTGAAVSVHVAKVGWSA